MDSIIRGAVVYLFCLLIFRVAGKRTLAETTPFDLVLLLIISETTQQAMIDNDHSVIHAFLLIITLVGLDIAFSLIKQRSKAVEKVLEEVPLILLENGTPYKDRMDKSRVDESDILAAARMQLGLERLDQIKYAILEREGNISIIEKPGAKS